MLSGAVKAQSRDAFPNAMINDSYGASETGASGSEVGASTTSDRPAFATDGAHLGARSGHARDARARFGQGRACSRGAGTSRSATGRTEAKTAATFRTDADGVRWVVPGDFATIDDDGRVVLFGRGSGCINTGGEKVFPEEVEAAIRAHADVFDAVVVGMPDERFGQKVVALVQLRDGVADLDLDALQAHCRDADRRVQGAACSAARRRAAHQRRQARLRDRDQRSRRTPRGRLSPSQPFVCSSTASISARSAGVRAHPAASTFA